MPQVVGSAGERRGGQFRAERGLTGGVPDAPVGALAEDAATGATEQPPVRRSPELAQVLPEQAGQRTSNGRRLFFLRRIVWMRTSNAFMATPEC